MSKTKEEQTTKDFGVLEREKFNSRFRGGMILGLVGTALIVIFGFLGMTKLAALLCFAPLLLVISPIYWWFSMRTLKAAVGHKNPKLVVEMFLKNLKEGFDKKSDFSNTDFAFQYLTMEARQAIGSPDKLREQWQGKLSEIVNSEVEKDVFTGSCQKCSSELVFMELNRSVLGDFTPRQKSKCWARCTNCKALICQTCIPSRLESSAPCTACGEILPLGYTASGSFEPIVPKDHLSPYLSLDSIQKVEADEEKTLMTANINIWLTKGLVNTRFELLSMLVAKVSMDYQLQKVEEQWFINNGLPSVSKLQIKDYEKRLTAKDIYGDEVW